MKPQESVKYPQSLELFKFCLRVFSYRRPNEDVRCQDLGRMIGLSASDTSQWKYGRKTFRKYETFQAIAEVLDVPLELLRDVLDGVSGQEEAWSDFKDVEREQQFARMHESARQLRCEKAHVSEALVNELTAQAGLATLPVYLPGLIEACPGVKLSATDFGAGDEFARAQRVAHTGEYVIRHRKGDTRAHARLAVAREFAKVLLDQHAERYAFSSHDELLKSAVVADLANILLMPKESFVMEMQKLSSRDHMVDSLSAIFWVPRSVVQARLSSILLGTVSTLSLPMRVALHASTSRQAVAAVVVAASNSAVKKSSLKRPAKRPSSVLYQQLLHVH